MKKATNAKLPHLQEFVSDGINDFLAETPPTTNAMACSSNAHYQKSPTYSLEADIDKQLLQFGEELGELTDEPTTKRPKLETTDKKQRVFAPPKTTEGVEKAKLHSVPAKTQQDTAYCLRVWHEWCAHKLEQYGEQVPPIEKLQPSELAKQMSSFVFEVRKKDGKEFPPNSLHHLVCGLQWHIRFNKKASIDIFKDDAFAEFRVCLDAEMKRLQQEGLGSKSKKAEPLTEHEEDLLWRKGLLGKHLPQALLDTIVLMNGVYFALRSGQEHRQLRADPCQITVHERPGERPYLEYREDISKNHSGGIKGRKCKPKIVQHHSNTENPDRCFVTLFKLYQSLCPSDRPSTAFYLKPLQHPRVSCWFSKQPLGHNKLQGTVARLCKDAGIPGFKTNHSLRATAATRLYNAGVEEQQVMEVTGHRSLEGVRTYKHTSTSQKQQISDILNCQEKQLEPVNRGQVSSKQPIQTQNISSQSLNMTYSVPQTSTFNFHSCTVNIYNHHN